jgi:hypothetical protein
MLVYGESFPLARLVGFSVVWLALFVFAVEGFVHRSTAGRPSSPRGLCSRARAARSIVPAERKG